MPASFAMSDNSALALMRQVIPKRRNEENGGAEQNRTADLCLAKAALSQLSYGPFILNLSGD